MTVSVFVVLAIKDFGILEDFIAIKLIYIAVLDF